MFTWIRLICAIILFFYSKAGIPPERLLIALEPEVASIYVQWMETDKANSGGYNIAATGTKYLVADIGGNNMITDTLM